jgi:hypothetical protein
MCENLDIKNSSDAKKLILKQYLDKYRGKIHIWAMLTESNQLLMRIND